MRTNSYLVTICVKYCFSESMNTFHANPIIHENSKYGILVENESCLFGNVQVIRATLQACYITVLNVSVCVRLSV